MMQTPATRSRWSCGRAILFQPENPLAPRDPVFDEAWQAQVLAIADTMVQAGRFSATAWAETLGAELRAAEAAGQPDTTQTYYEAALVALERLTTRAMAITEDDLAARKADWTRAYERTPHGQPVLLERGQPGLTIVETDPRSPDAVQCMEAYYAELARRFAQGFDVNLSRDPEAGDMAHPRGAFLVAFLDGAPVGCVGLKGSGTPVAEIKRLWVSPKARGRKLATQLMTHAEDIARGLGITTLRLDTNSALPEAAALYRKSGWTEIDRFNDDPYPDMFFEKRL